jgi:hypothetical protein
MPYTSPDPSFNTYNTLTVLSQERWVQPFELSQLRDRLQLIIFPVVAQRDFARSLLELGGAQPIFSFPLDPTRFPQNGVFCPLSDPVLSNILTTLHSSLSYRDRMLELNKRQTDPITSITPAFTQAYNSYYNALRQLNDFLAYPASFLSRTSFELRYSLTWN